VVNGVTYVAVGIAAYDDALKLAIQSVMAGQTVPGRINVATTSIGDAQAMARVQVASLAPDRALAEGYRRNNSGDYADAAVFFEALERQPIDPASGIDSSEFKLNRALQLSNLGNFAEAERLLAEAEFSPTADQVQVRLRRNFRAINALNQRDYDGALLFLDEPVPPLPIDEILANDRVAISPLLANALNSDSGNRAITGLSGDERLTPRERAILLDAQAGQLRGTVKRLTGDQSSARQSLEQALATALRVRDGRVTSIIRLRTQIMGELALVDEAEGRLSEADTRLRAAIALLEREYPETMALAASRARLGSYLSRHDRADEAVQTYREVVSALVQQRRQMTGLYNLMAPYYRLLIDRQSSDPQAIAEFFAATQLLVRPGVADTQAVLARELSADDGEAATLFRQANNLTRDLERSRVEFARLAASPADTATTQLLAELQVRIDNLAGQQTDTLARLSSYPQYRAISGDVLSLTDLQAALGPDEGYAKMSIVGDQIYVLMVTSGTARAWQATVSRDQLDAAVDQIRGTISVYEAGQYNTYPFDADTASRLFTGLFGPVAQQVAQTRHLIFEPDGAMLRLPLNLLITDSASVTAYQARVATGGADPFDMRGVAWLGRTSRVSTSVSALAFRNTRNAPASRGRRGYLGMGNNLPISDAISVAAVRGGDAAAADGCDWGPSEWNKPIADTELLSARNAFGAQSGEVVTGAAFTDRQIRNREDIGDYRILHFATHGLVTPPRPDCPTRPALLTSFDASDSDGLLSFDEIYDLRIDADLVILSACDTAGQASVSATRAAGVTTGGGSALDGLVRAFIGAGGRSVLASHWPAPDDFNATQRLISALFEAPAGTSVAEALGRAEVALMDEAATSHPYYWAGFAIIGDGNRPLIQPTAPVTANNESRPFLALAGL
jgi:CHAT domain-containing protein